ncbi:Peptidase S8 subtilisin-related protein [Dioscorea alata]|uniref:Peptidase S8 subtilisin-related protein n=1 Tax=Dioscorea alata TaxID=55571 RepID=A0ACB7WRK6_DIOAL|nr:Peptidase S8 subtilisin-related protein [Dioscorea alata]
MGIINHKMITVLALFLLSNACVLMTQSQRLSITDENQQENSTGTIRTYIVHVEDPVGNKELLKDQDFESWHKSFLPNTTLDSGEPRLIHSYRYVMGGFAAKLTHEEVKAMESMEGFLYAWPEQQLTGATTRSPDFLGLSEWQGLWRTSSYGTGMIIGVVDSGITPNHPSFTDDGSLPAPPLKWRGFCTLQQCNNKVIGAVAFQGRTNPSPEDENGHGTHVSATAAGNPVYNAGFLGQARGRAVGMAPKAHIATYKVLYGPSPGGVGNEGDFLAGINQAIRDGVDVLQMSLGNKRPIPLDQSSISVGSFGAILNNIFPSACAMNEGPTPSVISNDAPWILTVGASSIDRRIKVTVKLGNNMELDGESGYQPENYNSQEFPLIFPGFSGIQGAETCEAGSLDSLNVQGKIVVCLAGGNSGNTDKGEVVKAANGEAIIIVNPVNYGFTTISEPYTIPAAQVTNADGQKIGAYLRTWRNPVASLTFKGTQLGTSPAPTVAFFSGRGPSLNNGGVIKPDIIGPGVNILAAWHRQVVQDPNTNVAFNFDSGTSMATPHLSGIAADLRNNHPTWSPAAIKSAIMTTAYTQDLNGNRILDDSTGRPASFFVMGAGHVNPDRANDPGLVYDMQPIDYVPYLCNMYDSRTTSAFMRQRIDCRYVKTETAEQLNYPSIAVSLQVGQTKTIERTLTNVGGSETYAVNVNAPNGVNLVANTTSLVFASTGEKQGLSLEFTNNGLVSPGEFWEGSLTLNSATHTVWSPISVTFV